jgi:hypothetical protein
MYWLENVIFLAAFFILELCLVIPVYVKNIVIIPWASSTIGIFTPVVNLAVWITCGIPISLYILVNDVVNLFKILRMVEGCRKANGIEDELKEE